MCTIKCEGWGVHKRTEAAAQQPQWLTSAHWGCSCSGKGPHRCQSTKSAKPKFSCQAANHSVVYGMSGSSSLLNATRDSTLAWLVSKQEHCIAAPHAAPVGGCMVG